MARKKRPLSFQYFCCCCQTLERKVEIERFGSAHIDYKFCFFWSDDLHITGVRTIQHLNGTLPRHLALLGRTDLQSHQCPSFRSIGDLGNDRDIVSVCLRHYFIKEPQAKRALRYIQVIDVRKHGVKRRFERRRRGEVGGQNCKSLLSAYTLQLLQ